MIVNTIREDPRVRDARIVASHICKKKASYDLSCNSSSYICIIGNKCYCLIDNIYLAVYYISDNYQYILPNISFRLEEEFQIKDGNIYNEIDNLDSYYEANMGEYIFNLSINYKQYLTDNHLIAYDDNLRDNKEFDELITSIKSNDGMKLFRLNSMELNKHIYLPIISRFPYITKKDTIGVKVYKYNYNSFLVCYNIYINKLKQSYKLITRILDLDK